MAIEAATRFPDMSARGFAHPADRAAAAAILSVPMLDKAIKKLSEYTYERKLRQIYLGTSVRLGDDQLPAAWAMQRRAAYVLDIERCPTLYATQYPVGNALTIGTHEPITVVMSGLIAAYDDDELQAVLAHEMGHVLADHVGLTTVLELSRLLLTRVLVMGPLVGIPVRALYYALLEWHRAAELTADRVAAVATGDPMLVCRTLMRMAGGPIAGLDLDAFIAQATEYQAEGDPVARYQRFWTEIGTTHPFPVHRVKELVAWVADGEYDRIRSGEYLRRGQEPPASHDFDVAYQHYRERFARMVDRVGTGVQTVVDRFSSWLEGRDDGPGPEGEGGLGDDDGGFGETY